MKEKINKFIYNFVYAFSILCFWFECAKLTEKYCGTYWIGTIIGVWLIYVYVSYKDDK